MAEVYLKAMGLAAGDMTPLSELAARGVVEDAALYAGEGYRQAAVATGRAGLLDQIAIPPEADGLIYNAAFPQGAAADGVGDGALLERSPAYAGEQMLLRGRRADMPYLGVTQKGCCGLMAAIDIAAMRVSVGRSAHVFCVSEDILPPGAARGLKRNRMLLSDTVSFATVTARPARYRLLAMRETSVLGMSFLQIASATGALIEALCEGILAPGDVQNVIFPNHWRGAWSALMRRLALPCRFEESTIATLAHGLSADAVANLALYEQRGFMTPGNAQIALAYGYGGHLSGMLLGVENCADGDSVDARAVGSD